MPPTLALMAALTGAAYGLFPISWIVFSSIMLYRLAVHTGLFETIKDSVGGLTSDRRLQALFIAFSFGRSSKGRPASAHRGRLGGDADGSRLPGVPGGRHLPDGQHRAGGVRLHRHPGHDARRYHRHSGAAAERDGRRLCAMIS
jgi:hypothetical protein